MNALHGFVLLALAAVPGLPANSLAEDKPLAHSETEFQFTVQAGYERVFPLFGALEEMKWAEGWKPLFVYPSPAHDQRGMVFTAAHGDTTSTWVCTAYDEAAGFVQYVYMVHELVVTQINIHVTKAGAAETQVSVVYERTALSAAANEHIAHLAKMDASSGPEWAEAINGYFAKLDKARASKPSAD